MQPSHRSKAADFEVLKTASNALLDYFRMDETQPDLYEQISSHDSGAHKYYIEPYHTTFPVKMVCSSMDYTCSLDDRNCL